MNEAQRVLRIGRLQRSSLRKLIKASQKIERSECWFIRYKIGARCCCGPLRAGTNYWQLFKEQKGFALVPFINKKKTRLKTLFSQSHIFQFQCG